MENHAHEFDTIDLMTYACGGCDKSASEVIEAHLTRCDRCRTLVESLKAENAQFIATYPFLAPPPKAGSLSTNRVAFRMRHAYAIAASIAILLTTGYFFHSQYSAPSYGIKGEEGLALFVQNARGVVEQRGAQRYASGERIQFVYSCGQRHHFMLFSADTTGAVTRYYPQAGDSSVVLEPGQGVPLTHSIVLDNYTGRELFMGIFSDKKLRADSVQQSIEAVIHRAKSLDSITIAGGGILMVKRYIIVERGSVR